MTETKISLPLNKKIILPLIAFLGCALLLILLLFLVLPNKKITKYEWRSMSFYYPAGWSVEENVPVSHAVVARPNDIQLLTLSNEIELASLYILSDRLSETDIQAKEHKDQVLSFMNSPDEDIIADIQLSEPTATELRISEITLNNRIWKKTEYLKEYKKSYPNESVILQEVRYRGIFEDHFITIQYSCPAMDEETLHAFEEVVKSLQLP